MNAIARGLDGVVVDETKVCLADKQSDRLYYRGYAIEDLAAEAGYEEVAYLLVKGDLPTRVQLEEYRRRIAAARALPAPLVAVLDQLPADANPMDVMRTACSVLGSLEPETAEHGLAAVGERVMACLPTALLYWHHRHHGGKAATPGSSEADVAGNHLTLLHGTPPDALRRCMAEQQDYAAEFRVVWPDETVHWMSARGRFDYASLSTNDLETAQRFSILILSDDLGATVREAAPPAR